MTEEVERVLALKSNVIEYVECMFKYPPLVGPIDYEGILKTWGIGLNEAFCVFVYAYAKFNKDKNMSPPQAVKVLEKYHEHLKPSWELTPEGRELEEEFRTAIKVLKERFE